MNSEQCSTLESTIYEWPHCTQVLFLQSASPRLAVAVRTAGQAAGSALADIQAYEPSRKPVFVLKVEAAAAAEVHVTSLCRHRHCQSCVSRCTSVTVHCQWCRNSGHQQCRPLPCTSYGNSHDIETFLIRGLGPLPRQMCLGDKKQEGHTQMASAGTNAACCRRILPAALPMLKSTLPEVGHAKNCKTTKLQPQLLRTRPLPSVHAFWWQEPDSPVTRRFTLSTLKMHSEMACCRSGPRRALALVVLLVAAATASARQLHAALKNLDLLKGGNLGLASAGRQQAAPDRHESHRFAAAWCRQGSCAGAGLSRPFSKVGHAGWVRAGGWAQAGGWGGRAQRGQTDGVGAAEGPLLSCSPYEWAFVCGIPGRVVPGSVAPPRRSSYAPVVRTVWLHAPPCRLLLVHPRNQRPVHVRLRDRSQLAGVTTGMDVEAQGVWEDRFLHRDPAGEPPDGGDKQPASSEPDAARIFTALTIKVTGSPVTPKRAHGVEGGAPDSLIQGGVLSGLAFAYLAQSFADGTSHTVHAPRSIPLLPARSHDRGRAAERR